MWKDYKQRPHREMSINIVHFHCWMSAGKFWNCYHKATSKNKDNCNPKLVVVGAYIRTLVRELIPVCRQSACRWRNLSDWLPLLSTRASIMSHCILIRSDRAGHRTHCCWRMGCRRRSVNMEGATTHSWLRAALTDCILPFELYQIARGVSRYPRFEGECDRVWGPQKLEAFRCMGS